MHALQPKHTKMKSQEVESLLNKFNISLLQLPKIKFTDPALPEGCNEGDVIKIERRNDKEVVEFYRVVI